MGTSSDEVRAEYRQYLSEPWKWRAFIRRVECLTKGEKYILHVLSDTARKTGMGARPGLAKLSVEAQADRADVAAALRHARELGLLWVAHEGRRGAKPDDPDTANEYWLILHPDVFERTKVVDPDAQRAKAIEVRERRRKANARAYVLRKEKKARKAEEESVGSSDLLNTSMDMLADTHPEDESVGSSDLLKDESVGSSDLLKDESVGSSDPPYSLKDSTGSSSQNPDGDEIGKREHPRSPPEKRCEHGFIDTQSHRCVFCARGLPADPPTRSQKEGS